MQCGRAAEEGLMGTRMREKMEGGLVKRELRELGGDSSLKQMLFELSVEDKGTSKQGVS